MPLLDMNMNMNMSIPVSNSGGRSLGIRFNSDVESREVDVSQPNLLVPPPLPGVNGGAAFYPPFHPFWDADLHACMHLDDFLTYLNRTTPNTTTWRAVYGGVARSPVPADATVPTNTPPSEMSQGQLGADVLRILELALEREDRFAEVIDQDDADGAINYWRGMLKIDPSRHPATNLMLHVARRIGEHVSMCLKGDFMCPRPSQVAPAITPMIDPPATPSFPAGHAVQSYLISYLLAYSLSDSTGKTNLPQHNMPAPTSLGNLLAPATRPTGPLFDLARRVSQNRIVAGIHYPTDIRAGHAVAAQIFLDVQKVATIWGAAATDPNGLRFKVRTEFPQYAA
jgi:membrane-associated phospholipid phosphatase